MPTGGRRGWTRVFPALALLLAVAPFLAFRGRVIDEEAVGFLRKYWDADRGALVKIFDVRGWDFYQGRELSYAIDYLDAQWVGLVLRTGTLFFGAPSALLASLALVLVVARLGPRALPRLGPPARWLCLLLLLSNFVFLMTMGTLYRATKPLVAPLVLGLFLLALAEHRAPRLSARAAALAAFAMALAMSALDRQGLFYVLAIMAVLSFTWLRERRGLPLVAGMAAAVATWYAYFRILGPWLIQRLEGYCSPTASSGCARAARRPRAWRQALGILADWTTVVLGSLPAVALAVAVAAGALGGRGRSAARRGGSPRPSRSRPWRRCSQRRWSRSWSSRTRRSRGCRTASGTPAAQPGGAGLRLMWGLTAWRRTGEGTFPLIVPVALADSVVRTSRAGRRSARRSGPTRPSPTSPPPGSRGARCSRATPSRSSTATTGGSTSRSCTAFPVRRRRTLAGRRGRG